MQIKNNTHIAPIAKKIKRPQCGPSGLVKRYGVTLLIPVL